MEGGIGEQFIRKSLREDSAESVLDLKGQRWPLA